MVYNHIVINNVISVGIVLSFYYHSVEIMNHSSVLDH